MMEWIELLSLAMEDEAIKALNSHGIWSVWMNRDFYFPPSNEKHFMFLQMLIILSKTQAIFS